MYEIGQTLICVKDHSQGAVKKGKTYPLLDFKKDCCGNLVFDVGVKPVVDIARFNIGQMVWCTNGEHIVEFDGVWWLSADRFRPIDDIYNEEIKELTEALNEPVTFD